MKKQNTKIKQLYAILSVDEDGNEGIFAKLINGSWYPAVTSNLSHLKKMKKDYEGLEHIKCIAVTFDRGDVIK